MSLQSVIDAALEALGDRTAYLKGVLDGALQYSANLVSATGHVVNVNGNTFAAAADGGTINVPGGIIARDLSATNGILANGAAGLTATGSGGVTASTVNATTVNSATINTTGAINATGAIHANGYCYAPIAIAQGPVTAGTWTFVAATVQLVFNNAATAAGVIWKIDGTGALQGTTIRFTQANPSNNITLQNPAGVTLATLSAASGGLMGISVALLGSTWTIVDYTIHP